MTVRMRLCTAYLSRPVTLVQDILPIFKDEHVAGYNWGLVTGRSQTNYSWTSWAVAVPGPPSPWFHDILHPDGRPYDETETTFIRNILAKE